MPLVEVTIAEGRTAAQIRSLMQGVHEAVLRTVNTRPEHIRVIVREVPREHWATGDVTLSEMDDGRRSRTGADAADKTRPAAERPGGTPPGDEEQS
jgi:4-oxalocrotonate tautomerase